MVDVNNVLNNVLSISSSSNGSSDTITVSYLLNCLFDYNPRDELQELLESLAKLRVYTSRKNAREFLSNVSSYVKNVCNYSSLSSGCLYSSLALSNA